MSKSQTGEVVIVGGGVIGCLLTPPPKKEGLEWLGKWAEYSTTRNNGKFCEMLIT